MNLLNIQLQLNITKFRNSHFRNLAILNSGRGVRQRASSNSTLPDSLTFCRDESRPDTNCEIAKLRDCGICRWRHGPLGNRSASGPSRNFAISHFRNPAILTWSELGLNQPLGFFRSALIHLSYPTAVMSRRQVAGAGSIRAPATCSCRPSFILAFSRDLPSPSRRDHRERP